MTNNPIDFCLLKNNQILMEMANELPKQGKLEQLPSGFVYVKVDEGYVNKLLPYFDVKGEAIDRSSKSTEVGAHISIIYPEEIQKALKVDVFNRVIHFELLGAYQAQFNEKNYYVIRIKSQPLAQIRVEQGLSEQPVFRGHEVDFHITFAKS